jgi:hypothetical protein
MYQCCLGKCIGTFKLVVLFALKINTHMQKFNPLRFWLILFVLSYLYGTAQAQTSPLVTYAGGGAGTSFTDVVQLSNGHFIISGAAQHLDWIPPNVPRLQLSAVGISNNQGTNKMAFLLEWQPATQYLCGRISRIWNRYWRPLE